MSTKSRDYEKELEGIAGGIVDSIFEAADEEILEEVVAAGKDPVESAERVRGVLMDAVMKHRKERMRQAREGFERRQRERPSYDDKIPGTEEQRRLLLARAFKVRPYQQSLTSVQFRDLDSLPDEDVISLLRQLAELGVLDEL